MATALFRPFSFWCIVILYAQWAAARPSEPSSYATKAGYTITISDYSHRYIGNVQGKINKIEERMVELARPGFEYLYLLGVRTPLAPDATEWTLDLGDNLELYYPFELRDKPSCGLILCYLSALIRWLREWRAEDWLPAGAKIAPTIIGRWRIATNVMQLRMRTNPGIPEVEGASGSHNNGSLVQIQRRTTAAAAGRRLPSQRQRRQQSSDTVPAGLNGTTEAGMARMNVSSLGALPPDPWRLDPIERDSAQYARNISNFVDQHVYAADMSDLLIDCFVTQILDVERTADAGPYITCGQRDNLVVYLRPMVLAEATWAISKWDQLWQMADALSFYRKYNELGVAWAPSVRSYRVARTRPGGTVWQPTVMGWWGKPVGVVYEALGTGAGIGDGSVNGSSRQAVTEVR